MRHIQVFIATSVVIGAKQTKADAKNEVDG